MLLGLSVQVAVTLTGTKAWIKEGLGTRFREDLIKNFVIFPFCNFDYSFGIIMNTQFFYKNFHSLSSTTSSIYI